MPRLDTQRVKQLMDERRMSQATIADRVDVDPSAVSRWFKGVNPSSASLESLAAALDTTVDDITVPDDIDESKRASPNFNPEFNLTPNYTPTNITIHNIESLTLILPDGTDVSKILADLTKKPDSPGNNNG